jgi:hypothetical protein
MLYPDLHRSVDYTLDAMETIKESNSARIVEKLAVTAEPGLTNAQLMLTNEDLKPGEQCLKASRTESGTDSRK